MFFVVGKTTTHGDFIKSSYETTFGNDHKSKIKLVNL